MTTLTNLSWFDGFMCFKLDSPASLVRPAQNSLKQDLQTNLYFVLSSSVTFTILPFKECHLYCCAHGNRRV